MCFIKIKNIVCKMYIYIICIIKKFNFIFFVGYFIIDKDVRIVLDYFKFIKVSFFFFDCSVVQKSIFFYYEICIRVQCSVYVQFFIEKQVSILFEFIVFN